MMKTKITVLSAAAIGACSMQAAERPNIVFFLVDDLGWMDVGYNGSNFYYTPTIDSLAAEGMIFNQAYSMPTSSPSRASCMSGLYQPHTGIYAVDLFAGTPERMKKLVGYRSKTELDRNIPTIAELLQRNGYTTCHIGKWHLGNDSLTYPLARGFDRNVGGCEAGKPGSYYPPFPGIRFIPPKENDAYLTDRLTDEAVDFLEHHDGRSPFFLNMCFYAVHVPVEPYAADVAVVAGRRPERGRNNSEYAAMVYSVDRSIARILEVLRARGLDKNTLIVFTSDNGGQSMVTDNHPLRGQKGNIYEGGIRVPTFVVWPGIVEAGTARDTPISIVDYFPTMAQAAGIPESTYAVDGRSLLGLLSGQDDLRERSLFWHLPNYTGKGTNAKVWQAPVSAIRKGRWKLIRHYEDNSVELYDVVADLSETDNRASTCREVVDSLSRELEAWLDATEAPLPHEKNQKYVEGSRAWIEQ